MPINEAKRFFDALQTDDVLANKVKSADPNDIVKIAADSGFDFTIEDLCVAEKDLRKKIAKDTDRQIREISVNELDSAAGGDYGMGCEAPDGHELGCLITWHHDDYQIENKIWCKGACICENSFMGETEYVIFRKQKAPCFEVLAQY